MKKTISQEVIEQLKYTHVKSKNVDLNNFPDFMIVGPQRTGTTWLSENVQLHPEIFFSRPKEIYFFNLLELRDHPLYISGDLEWYSSFFKDTPFRYFIKNLVCLKRYRKPYRPKIKGEGTASYAAMDRHIIQEIVKIKPDIKAIMMVRNPINRAWSHTKIDLLNISLTNKTPRNISDVPEQECMDFFQHPYQVRCGNYSRNIENWSSILKGGHLLTLCFDDVAERPLELLLQVFNFLGVDSNPKYIDSRILHKRIAGADSKTGRRELPSSYKKILEGLFSEELAKMEDRFGRPLAR